jgi:hypothetical protein
VAGRNVQRRATSARCQRRIVSGRTNTLPQRSRGSNRERALSRIRSPELKRGRTPCRRRTASSWRSTTTSTAFAASQRRRTISSSASRRTSQYTVEAIIPRSSHPPPAQRHTGFPAPTGPTGTHIRRVRCSGSGPISDTETDRSAHGKLPSHSPRAPLEPTARGQCPLPDGACQAAEQPPHPQTACRAATL